MNKKFKGFSLAELLISLLVISIVLSAAIPAITKKAGQQRELIWRWTDQNNIAFSAVGANQSVIVGLDTLPMENAALYSSTNDATALLYDASSATGSNVEVNKLLLDDVKYSDSGDKLSILKRKTNDNLSDFVNSHISFFTMDNSASATNAKYAGRLTMDASNIALGKGTLQSIDRYVKNSSGTNTSTELAGENTAIGHFALLRNTQGYRNTAIGKKSLSNNFTGYNNTALGFASLYKLGKTESYTSKTIGTGSNTETLNNEHIGESYENTAVGSEAQYSFKYGYGNTAVGSKAMQFIENGNNNTAIGQKALHGNNGTSDGFVSTTASQNTTAPTGNFNTAIGGEALRNLVTGDSNTVIGYAACANGQNFSENICIGHHAGRIAAMKKDKFGLYIGGGFGDEDLNKKLSDNTTLKYPKLRYIAPLISGHTVRTAAEDTETKAVYDQELVINARKVKFQPYLGKFPVFEFDMLYGNEDGYDAYNTSSLKTRYGTALFNLIDSGDTSTNNSLSLRFAGKYRTSNSEGNLLQIDAWNPVLSKQTYANVTEARTVGVFDYSDIYLNNQLLIDFPKPSQCTTTETGTTCPANHYINIGLYNTTSEYADTPEKKLPLVLNNKIFVTNADNAPQLTMDDDGFKVNMSPLLSETKENNELPIYSYLNISRTGGSGMAFLTGSTTGLVNTTPHFYIDDKRFEALLQNGSYNYGISINGSQTDYIRMGVSQTGTESDYNVATHEMKLDLYDLFLPGLANKYKQQYTETSYSSYHTSLVGIIQAISNDINNIVNPSSDARLKNISGDNTAGLKEINQLQVKNFTYKNDAGKVPHVGVIAQQLQKIFPNAVTKDEEGYLRIRQEDIFYAMVNSIKELLKQIQDLTAKISGLDKKITELENQNKLLKEQNSAFEKRLIELEKKQSVLENKIK